MRILCTSLLALLLVPACDSSSKPKGPSEEEKKAAQEQAETDKRIDERRKKREAEAKAKEDAEAAKQEKIAALCVLPEDAKPPKKLSAACQGVVDAEVAFLDRHYADNPTALEKLKSASKMQTQMTMQMCEAGGSINVAVCQKHALDNAPKEFKKDLSALKRVCVDKFGSKKAPAGAAVVPKKPR
ncbi:MAG: hypothetical protein K0V04_44580 [Deltaproteobacteria bacterium]|nr:hypothetical protein [Deltaproteobacteria bacterium]